MLFDIRVYLYKIYAMTPMLTTKKKEASKQTNRTQTKMHKKQERTCYIKINGKEHHLKTLNFR